MPDTVWKALERRVAKYFGAVRNPLSGGTGRHTRGDVIHDELYIEVRYRKRWSIVSMMKEIETNAKAEDKLPILALQQARNSEVYYVIPHWALYEMTDILTEDMVE